MIVPISDGDAYHANMLFIFAAGNNGQECFGGIGECNLLAAAIDSMRQDDGEKDAGERVLFVGALSDDSFGTDRKSLARYSHPAGDMVNDFIVAHDDIFEAGIVRSSSGTSYTAPRVAGAAKPAAKCMNAPAVPALTAPFIAVAACPGLTHRFFCKISKFTRMEKLRFIGGFDLPRLGPRRIQCCFNDSDRN